MAEARNTLPALIHEAEQGPIQIVRRGKPVAVLQSQVAFERTLPKERTLVEASAGWRRKYRDVLDDEDWLLPRDKSSTGGRKPLRWR